MAITVRRLTQRPELGLTLVAGRDGADRVIDWAHAIELADPAPWLSGGELVMTTGIKIGGSADEQFRYVSALAHAGTVALAFDTGTTYSAVPEGIRAAGDALGFPILAVPAETPFIAITRAVIDELTADQVRAVQRVVDQQENLVRATLRGGIPAVVSSLSRALTASVMVVDNENRVLAEAGANTESLAELMRHAIARHGTKKRQRMSRVVEGATGVCTVQSVAAQQHHGYLGVLTAGQLSPPDRLLTAHAVSLVAIELGKPAAVADAEERLRNAVTAALVTAPAQVSDAVLRYFGFDSNDQVGAVALADVGPILTALRRAAEVLQAEATPYLMGAMDTEIVIILPAAASSAAPRLRDSISAQLERKISGGAGLLVPISETATSVRQAVAAARTGRFQPGRFVDCATSSTFSLLLGSRSRDELEALAATALGALHTHDRKHRSSLVDTLAAYLESNGHIEVAASVLGVHRHTMRNRLHKITELIGRDPDSAYVRADLWLALQASRMVSALRGS
ncbi:PucR family transcriptional regulator ligand-binding domain-containing protein [Hoyosella sp. YIM 151337]|uniref:PucR family transcriptional regulator n=1 Tax=Hoyosella sp. YIM 151337 TaxID=2992742 RepID=UPI0022362633|nr:PucR family transcriptional regulator [Hoyosella sp. YIM 151337]MCW4354265.1 PucR family transcriptional regulator ligand-binding domain-containing protein [Hoyosella sp. YIM 151337]